MLKYLKSYFIFFVLSVAFFILPQFSLNSSARTFDEGLTTTATEMGYLGNYPLKDKSIGEIIAIGVKALIGIIGIILVFLLIYGGFVWMKARGNDTDVKRAQDIIRNAIIGIILVLSAYAITNLAFSKLLTIGASVKEYPRH